MIILFKYEIYKEYILIKLLNQLLPKYLNFPFFLKFFKIKNLYIMIITINIKKYIYIKIFYHILNILFNLLFYFFFSRLI